VGARTKRPWLPATGLVVLLFRLPLALTTPTHFLCALQLQNEALGAVVVVFVVVAVGL
jgi:hypothetical protein